MEHRNNIGQLLEKYWEGETSLDEERLLKAYFAGSEVETQFLYAAPFFKAIRAEQALRLPAHRVALLKPQRPVWYRWAVAASVAGALALGGWWMAQQRLEQQRLAALEKLNTDTYEDPEKAAEEIKAALALVSSKMRKGKREAAKGLKKMETIDKFFKKPKKENS
jgi:hypothetical protein